MWKFSSKSESDPSTTKAIKEGLTKLKSRTDIGFKNEEVLSGSIARVKVALEEFDFGDHLFLIGIGGSNLGTKAFCPILDYSGWQNKITFLDNVDACTLYKNLEKIQDPERVSWLVISKSGGTIETLSLYDYCQQYLQEHFKFDIRTRTAVITEEKDSPLSQLANQHNMTKLPVPFDVGGRFSVFTPVGLFPLAYLGVDLDSLAEAWGKAINDEQRIVSMATELYSSLKRDELAMYLFYYSDRLVYWGEWLQQLWAESLSKAEDVQGNPGPILNTIVPCRGATYQHSVLQQIAEGLEKKLVVFVREGEAEAGPETLLESVSANSIMEGKPLGALLAAEAEATQAALEEKGISTMRLSTSQLSPQALVELMATWMMVVGTLGEVLQINAYDQPGVESGKRLARLVLSGSH